MRDDIEKTFIHLEKWEDILRDIDQIKGGFIKEHEKLDEKFENWRDQEARIVEKTCQGLMDIKFSKYEKVSIEFQKFFGVDELSYMLDNKADLSMIERLKAILARKEELVYTEQLIQNLNDRVKHLATLFTAMASSLLPFKNSLGKYDDQTKKQVLVQMRNIQKQSKVINTWINETELRKTINPS